MAALPLTLVLGCGSSSSGFGSTSSGHGGVTGTATFPQNFATDRASQDCTMALSGDTTSTMAQFTMGKAGELISHVADANGNLGRHDDQVTPGSGPVYRYPYPPSAVNDVGAVLHLPDGTQVGCTITQR